MATIWKYPVPIRDEFEHDMPEGARVLAVQMQFGHPQMWVHVIPHSGNPPVRRRFGVYGTGNPCPEQPGEYIATFQDGPMVWHVFERR